VSRDGVEIGLTQMTRVDDTVDHTGDDPRLMRHRQGLQDGAEGGAVSVKGRPPFRRPKPLSPAPPPNDWEGGIDRAELDERFCAVPAGSSWDGPGRTPEV